MGDGRTALVTGAARGIGAAVVDDLCAQGYRVLAVDACAGEGAGRPAGVGYPLATPEELAAVGDRHGGRVRTRVVDVRDRDALTAAVRDVEESYGGLDAVVAAAAVMTGGAPLWETTGEQLAAQWDVTVGGVWNAAAAGVPALLRRPEPRTGRFVTLSSVAGQRGLFGLSAYTAAKHAVEGIVRGLASDLVGTGVTAAAVAPGSTRTAMLAATAALYGLDDVEELASSQQVRRLLEPAEVAAAVAFCCSPAGAVVSGSVLPAHGGFDA